MEQAPACSVIVPTYRRPTQLVRCLEALSRLDYPRGRYEVIVVDDGGSIAAADLTTAFHDRLRLVLLTQPHGGPAAARNLGAAHAEGELLLFTDDDCMPDPRWLQVLARRFVEAPERATGGHTVNVLDGNLYASTSQLIIDVGYAHNNCGTDTARFFTTNNLAVPAADFRQVGGFDPSFRTSEDREFCTRWIDHGLRLDFEPSAVVNHAHDLSFRTFCRQHFAYGRGALRYHTKQARRANRVRIEPAYYLALFRAPFSGFGFPRALRITALLGVWHLANTAGFVFEWATTRSATS